MTHVAICVATFGRPDLLRPCLTSIIESVVCVTRYRVTIIVVDNHESVAVEPLLRDLSGVHDLELVLCHEPRPGIPFARNKALVEALARDADFIAFIDDDEVADCEWFDQIMTTVDQDGVDVVSGVVFLKGDRLIPKYPKRSAERDRAETDNVVFRSWLARALRFDESFAYCGGSDNLFFRQAYELGARIRTCESAIVTESLPPARRSWIWRVKRQWRYGIVSTMIEKRLQRGRKPAQIWLLGIIQMPLGFAQWLIEFLLRRELGMRGLDRFVRGAGMLAGLVGLRYDEYKRD
jgi:glycosyltransferase involved in cell wall biosynthesis